MYELDFTDMRFVPNGNNKPGKRIHPEDHALALDAITKRCNIPELQISGYLQEFTTKGDFPASVNDAIARKFQQFENWDNGWRMVFDELNLTNTDRSTFNIVDVTDGLTFENVIVGDKAKMYQMSGEKTTVNMLMYGGGLSWSRLLIDDREYWNLQNNAVAFSNAYFEFKAAFHYALIEAAAGALAWQVPIPPALPNTDQLYTANRDAATMNAAAIQIIGNTEDLGYGVSNNSRFVIVCPLQLEQRCKNALNLFQQAFQGSQSQTNFNFTLVTTTMLANTAVYYVCLPGNKILSGNRMNLTIFDAFDMLSYSDSAVGWFRFGAAVGNTEQIVRCATA